ncbi:thiosulfate sulfurtransferase isoform X2 [Malaclemys terrapin pileata]|uniref:thiosulfate sulfurtransferase isoform X2 n=1 Tax=Malaclemys terrapin pileata TaxID=2991368 RepID=UPI0023A874C7|nr:thiosulfate sulfurtransferase isoform X2 [Malaclemys terrapin pileata]
MMQQVLYRALVSTKWLSESVLAKQIGPSLRVLDASWYPPGERDAQQEFRDRHVPGASFFDIEECKDKSSPYELMLPSEAHFADYVGHLGISNDTHVVVYDGDDLGSFYAPRAWWMFRVFGHRTVSVLNGLEPGHIPGSLNMPFFKFLTEAGFEKSPEEIRSMFQEKKVDLSQPLIATCRKGVTACHIALAAYLCGKPDVAIYDGSWSEWFRRAPPEHKLSEWKRNKA